MSPKNTKSFAKINGRLDELVKKYSETNVAERIEQNVKSLSARTYLPNQLYLFGLFDEKYFDVKEENLNKHFPSYVFLDSEGKYCVFSGVEQYLLAKKNNQPLNAYLFTDLVFSEILSFVISEINNNIYNPLIKAEAYLKLKNNYNVTYQSLSSIIGISKPQIINTVKLLSLPDIIKQDIIDKNIPYSVIRPLNGLTSDEEKIKLYQKIKEYDLTAIEVENEVNHLKSKENKRTNRFYVQGKKIVINCTSKEEAARIKDELEKIIVNKN